MKKQLIHDERTVDCKHYFVIKQETVNNNLLKFGKIVEKLPNNSILQFYKGFIYFYILE